MFMVGLTATGSNQKVHPMFKPSMCSRYGFCLLLSVSSLLQADGFRNPPVGAASQARFGGNFAYSPDLSAISLNPANLVDFDEQAVMGSLTFCYSKMTFSSDLGPKVETEDPWAVLPALFMVMPPAENEQWYFGLGVTSPYGRSSTLPDDNVFSSAAPYYTQLMSLQIAPAFATRLSEKVSVGFAVNLLYSELNLRQKYPWSLATGVPGLPEGKTTFDAHGTGIGATVSLTYQATENQRVALRVQSPIKVDYRGNLDVTAIPPGVPAAPQSNFETEITFPLVVALGYGMQVTERLLLETNVEWVQHSTFDQLDLDAGVNSPLLPAASIPTAWEDNWTFGISASYVLNPEWVLRAGYIYLESPVPSSTMLPTTSEQDQGVIAIGAGYTPRPNHHIDVAYSLGLFSGRDVSDNINPAFNGAYDFEAHLLSLNYGYNC